MPVVAVQWVLFCQLSITQHSGWYSKRVIWPFREWMSGTGQLYADMALSIRLRPGDRALIRRTLQQQTIELENGAPTIMNHFYVTSLEVLSRSKRTSMTMYEKEKTR